MNKILYKRIDAFTSGNSAGNPAGVVYLNKDEQLSEEQMQAIARQEKGIVSEVVFCRLLEDGRYDLKYYSSECEVAFCGHGTIACMYDLISNDPVLMQRPVIMIQTQKGELPVYNEIKDSDSVFVTAPAPVFNPCLISGMDAAYNLGIAVDELDQNFKLDLINGGLNTLIVPIQSLSLILGLNPDCQQLQRFCIDKDIDIILVFCTETSVRESLYRTRVFAPKYGYLEDPATGSGNSSFGYYLIKHNRWDGNEIISIEQGPSRDCPNVVKIAARSNDKFQQVLFGGKAAVR